MDWDADGRKDLIVGSSTGQVNLFLNEGTNPEPVFQTTGYVILDSGDTLYVGAYSSPVVTDWNEDGLFDLLVGEGYGYIHLFLNRGTPGAPRFLTEDTLRAGGEYLFGGFGAVPFVGDWEGDGQKDLLIGDDDGYVSVFLNEGSNASPRFSNRAYATVLDDTLDVFYDAAPFAVDWNEDGALDLLAGQTGGLVVLFLCAPASVSLVPDTTIVLPGERLGYTRELTNHQDHLQTFFTRSEAWRDTSLVFQSSPERVVLNPNERRVEHLEQTIPPATPVGLYRCVQRIGTPGNEWFEDEFPLTIAAPR